MRAPLKYSESPAKFIGLTYILVSIVFDESTVRAKFFLTLFYFTGFLVLEKSRSHSAHIKLNLPMFCT